MKKRNFTQGFTIFTTPEMYQRIRTTSDDQGISISELVRRFIADGLKSGSVEGAKGGSCHDGE